MGGHPPSLPVAGGGARGARDDRVMTGSGPDVVTLGETLVILAAAPGPLVTTAQLTKSTGGSESNVAIGLARLGLRVEALTRVGADPFGAEIIRTLRAESVGVAGIEVDPDRPTGLMVKERPTADRANVFYYRAGSAAAGMDADSVQRGWDALDGPPRHVHLSGVTLALGEGPRRAADRLLALARTAGATVSFDANHRRRLWDVAAFRRACAPLAAAVDDLLVSDDEALALTGRGAGPGGHDEDVLRAALAELAATGPRRLVLRRGADGSLGTTPAGPVVPVGAVTHGPVVDVVGAGDAYTSGYLAELLAPAGGSAPHTPVAGAAGTPAGRGAGAPAGADPGDAAAVLSAAMATGSWVAGHVVASLGDWEGLPDAAALAAHRAGRRLQDR